eukprot:snap_masked-scaffold_4-processed-gene-14.43-mRNA-1 protein AED:1.00 eAED:1.00 QI:0/-1/0/0/-1/1/1/0/59
MGKSNESYSKSRIAQEWSVDHKLCFQGAQGALDVVYMEMQRVFSRQKHDFSVEVFFVAN